MRIKKGVNEQEELLVMMILGMRLKQLRERKGWTITELAKMANIDRDSYTKTEKGERNVTMGILSNVADALEILLSDIFNEDFRHMMQEAKREQKLKEIMDEDFCRLIDKKKVIKLIKRYRKSKQMSQTILALKLGIGRDVINNLEYGRGKIKAELLLSLMDLMKLNIEEFLVEIHAIEFVNKATLNEMNKD